MADGDRISIVDVVNMTTQLHADLMTAKGSSDSDTIHASLIEAVEGLLRCVKAIASELVKVEVEGLDTSSF